MQAKSFQEKILVLETSLSTSWSWIWGKKKKILLTFSFSQKHFIIFIIIVIILKQQFSKSVHAPIPLASDERCSYQERSNTITITMTIIIKNNGKKNTQF